jgi:hypothetical protein
MSGAVLWGAIVGFMIGWVIAAVRTRFTYLGGGYGMFEGPGCFATLMIEGICTALGAAVGALIQ